MSDEDHEPLVFIHVNTSMNSQRDGENVRFLKYLKREKHSTASLRILDCLENTHMYMSQKESICTYVVSLKFQKFHSVLNIKFRVRKMSCFSYGKF